MNIPLLRAIQARILAEPDAFRMDTWSCGTAHCIAGWALTLNGLKIANPGEVSGRQTVMGGLSPLAVAATLLELTSWASGLPSGSSELFFVEEWPRTFREAFETSTSRREKARIAAARIDHFIATEGRE